MVTGINEELREKAQKIKVIFFDIDDTLRLKDQEFMPDSIPEVFWRLREKSIITGIASGRASFGFPAEIMALGAKFYVTLNGQFVRAADGEKIAVNAIPAAVVEQIVDWLNREKIDYGMVNDARGAISRHTEPIANALGVVYGSLPVEPDFWRVNEVLQMWTFTDREVVLPPELRAHIRLIRWHRHSCDIIPTGGSKAGGIAKVLKKLRLGAENLLAFGDELNDIEMLEMAGVAVTFQAARPPVKAAADLITDDVAAHGVKHALEMLGIL